MGGAFWFLATLMELSVVFCIVDFVVLRFSDNNKKRMIAQSVISVIFLILGFACYKLGISLSGLDKVFSFYILYFGGNVLKTFNISAAQRKNIVHIGILVLSFAFLFFCTRIGCIGLSKNVYKDPIYLLLVSFIGWQFMYELSYFVGQVSILKKVCICMGQNTLSVVILHFLSFKIVSLIEVIVYNQPFCLIAAFPTLYTDNLWWIPYNIVGLLITITLSIAYRKSKYFFLIKNK